MPDRVGHDGRRHDGEARCWCAGGSVDNSFIVVATV